MSSYDIRERLRRLKHTVQYTLHSENELIVSERHYKAINQSNAFIVHNNAVHS